jgi:hypothetical protein
MREGSAKICGLACLLSPALVVVGLSADARSRRAEASARAPSVAAVAARLPTSDLALSGGARWLRAPSLEEPSAAFADGPGAPDPDPAGGSMAPPVPLWNARGAR